MQTWPPSGTAKSCRLRKKTAAIAKMSKGNLKDKLDGNELDLSLSNLEVVPVKDIVSMMAKYDVFRISPNQRRI